MSLYYFDNPEMDPHLNKVEYVELFKFCLQPCINFANLLIKTVDVALYDRSKLSPDLDKHFFYHESNIMIAKQTKTNTYALLIDVNSVKKFANTGEYIAVAIMANLITLEQLQQNNNHSNRVYEISEPLNCLNQHGGKELEFLGLNIDKSIKTVEGYERILVLCHLCERAFEKHNISTHEFIRLMTDSYPLIKVEKLFSDSFWNLFETAIIEIRISENYNKHH
ncbi:hypothetical protein [Endozoicomonas sp. ONNA1]|uniref:hypothetical protein n=1 Tax=Endozoicomonas sp. ONNA1 TaxID=2828740 RepID=UPI002149282D|nr:hypothetical protein [Endozoicomonas sp. ONNA1]